MVDTSKKSGGSSVHALFRFLSLALCAAALFVGALKIVPTGQLLAILPPDLASPFVFVARQEWLVVIAIAAAAIASAFVGTLTKGKAGGGASSPSSKWRDGVKIDKTKCAKSGCHRMRFAGKMLCPECWGEWQKQQPPMCAECGNVELAAETTLPLCKACHQQLDN